jgi:hypothetical protein
MKLRKKESAYTFLVQHTECLRTQDTHVSKKCQGMVNFLLCRPAVEASVLRHHRLTNSKVRCEFLFKLRPFRLRILRVKNYIKRPGVIFLKSQKKSPFVNYIASFPSPHSTFTHFYFYTSLGN